MREKDNTTMNKITKIINYIGYAGINEVNNLDTMISDNRNIRIRMESDLREGRAYHYYDYTVTILSKDGRELTITTQPFEQDTGKGYTHDTSVRLTYSLPNEKFYKLTGIIRGWSYGNLLNLKTDELKKILSPEVDESKGLLPSVPRNYRRYLFTTEEFDELIKLLDTNIELAIEEDKKDAKKVDEVLNTLSDNQIKILTKKLNNNKR